MKMMKYLNFKSEYNRFPKIKIKYYEEGIYDSYYSIFERIKKDNTKNTIVFECYPGVRYKELESQLFSKFTDAEIIFVDEYAKQGTEITEMIKDKLSNDRVFAFK